MRYRNSYIGIVVDDLTLVVTLLVHISSILLLQ